MNDHAILLCGHGSKKKEGIQGLALLAEKMQKRYQDIVVEYAFLELAHPTYYEAVKKLYDQGRRKIVAIPVFLFAGLHLNYEIPQLMKQYQQEMEGMEIRLTSHIGINDELIQLAEKRMIEAEHARYGKSHDRSGDLLLTMGIGSSIPEANADIARLTRLIWERTGFAHATYTFISKLTFPSVTESLEIIKNMPFDRIMVFPILLFPGLYLDRVFRSIESFRNEVDKEVLFAEPFGADELLVDIMQKKTREIIKLQEI